MPDPQTWTDPATGDIYDLVPDTPKVKTWTDPKTGDIYDLVPDKPAKTEPPKYDGPHYISRDRVKYDDGTNNLAEDERFEDPAVAKAKEVHQQALYTLANQGMPFEDVWKSLNDLPDTLKPSPNAKPVFQEYYNRYRKGSQESIRWENPVADGPEIEVQGKPEELTTAQKVLGPLADTYSGAVEQFNRTGSNLLLTGARGLNAVSNKILSDEELSKLDAIDRMGQAEYGDQMVDPNGFGRIAGNLIGGALAEAPLMEVAPFAKMGKAGELIDTAIQGGLGNVIAMGGRDPVENASIGALAGAALHAGIGSLAAPLSKIDFSPEGVPLGKGEAPVAEALPETRIPTKPEEDLTVAGRLKEALKGASKAREEQELLYKEERSKRYAELKKAQQEGLGKKSYENSLAALKGELPKADFQSVENQFSQPEIDELFDMITKTDTLSEYGKLSAYKGLADVMSGRVPQPKSLEHLRETFSDDFVKTVMSKRSLLAKSLGGFGEVWNLPKSLMSSVDLSAPLRQGIGLIHRKEFWSSFVDMFKYAAKSKNFDNLSREIKTHPNYALAEESGLSLTTTGDRLSAEDVFQSHLGEKIPVLGAVVRGSERAYVGFLNKLRFDTFNSMVNQAKTAGIDLHSDINAAKAVSNYVNIMTGRGHLGGAEKASKLLNGIFFSPRMISSRLDILTAPARGIAGRGFIAEIPPALRKEAAKSYAGIVAAWVTTLSLASMAGAKVSMNPFSSDFGKAVDKNIHLDPGAGFGQFVVAGAKALFRKSLPSGKTKTTDLVAKGNTPLDSDIKFLINKMHPSLTFFIDQQRGKDSVGVPFEFHKALIQRLTPMGLPDIVEALKEEPNNRGLAYGILGLLGQGLSVYDVDKKLKEALPGMKDGGPVMMEIKRLSAALDDKAVVSAVRKSDLEKAYKKADIKKEVSDEALEAYQQLAGYNINLMMEEKVKDKEWMSMTDEEKLKDIQTSSSAIRKAAREMIVDSLSQ